MRKSLSVCIAIMGLCFLLTGVSFADGGGVKKVDETKYGPGVNKYCEDNLVKYQSCQNGDGIVGFFNAYKGTSIFNADVFLAGVQHSATGQSITTKHYPISVTTDGSMALCDYTNVELMKRYQDYACKRGIDKDFGYTNVYPVVTHINVGEPKQCLIQKMLTGTITITMCPLKP